MPDSLEGDARAFLAELVRQIEDPGRPLLERALAVGVAIDTHHSIYFAHAVAADDEQIQRELIARLRAWLPVLEEAARSVVDDELGEKIAAARDELAAEPGPEVGSEEVWDIAEQWERVADMATERLFDYRLPPGEQACATERRKAADAWLAYASDRLSIHTERLSDTRHYLGYAREHEQTILQLRAVPAALREAGQQLDLKGRRKLAAGLHDLRGRIAVSADWEHVAGIDEILARIVDAPSDEEAFALYEEALESLSAAQQVGVEETERQLAEQLVAAREAPRAYIEITLAFVRGVADGRAAVDALLAGGAELPREVADEMASFDQACGAPER